MELEERLKVLQQLNYYLTALIEAGGSDLHFKTGGVIRARINGKLIPYKHNKISHDFGMKVVKALLRDEFEKFVEQKEYDFSYKLNEEYRFRCNAFFQIDGPSIIFRVLPTKIASMKDLNLPPVINKFVELERGLVLVTGVTGSGKSTTLAAIINEINEKFQKHIITIEDPVEFVHKDKNSEINQRNIGRDSLSFSNALRGALREDPDIILVGEMRDLETIEIALHAAETGHLVFSTLHTLDAKETINRIIGMFPTEEQNRIRLTLASVLEGVVSQRLVRTVDNKRAAAMEILLRTPRIAELIRENRDKEIKDSLEEGKELYGTQSFDQSLIELVMSGRIKEEEAIKNATNKEDFILALKKEKLRANPSDSDGEQIIQLKI